MAAKDFVDFAEIKRAVPLKSVLGRYKALDQLTGEGAQRKGPNPFDRVAAGGSKPFAANFDKNVWTLFRAEGQLSGNVIDFVMHKEGCSVRQAALKLAEWFDVGKGVQKHAAGAASAQTEEPPTHLADDTAGPSTRSNAPLNFALKGLDPHHASLEPLLFRWGIGSTTLEHFGAGLYSGNGKTMKGRLAAPIERDGQCVGYCGIDLDPDAEEQFKFPDKWAHGVEIYNLSNAIKVAEEAACRKETPEILVFRTVLQVWQADQLGYPCSVAILGDKLTAEQLSRLEEKGVLHRFPTVLQMHIVGQLL